MLNRRRRALRWFRGSTEALVYSNAFIIGVICFGIIDPQHNLAQVLFATGLILLLSGIGFLPAALPIFEGNSKVRRINAKHFAATLLAPGICLLVTGVLLYKTGICPPPFWAK